MNIKGTKVIRVLENNWCILEDDWIRNDETLLVDQNGNKYTVLKWIRYSVKINNFPELIKFGIDASQKTYRLRLKLNKQVDLNTILYISYETNIT